MMRNNGLLKWTLHKNKNGTNGKNWIHPPEALSTGHIVYLVKFLGVTDVEQPKGMDVVKESIRKLKLDEEIRRAEGGKTPKAELTISMDGVAIQEPKGKKILHQFPLHQISYCADDKEEKRFFSFIAKEGEVHKCFVFASDKLAEEITLTIGQAFDLAYKRYLDSSGRELDLKKEIMLLQKRVAELETENSNLKEKLSLHSVDGQSNSSLSSAASTTGGDVLMCPPVPARASTNVANQIIAEFAMTASEIEKRAHGNGNGRHMDLFDDEFDSKPRGNPDGIEAPPRISPPPKGKKTDLTTGNGPAMAATTNGNGFGSGSISGSSFGGSSTDVFGSDPFFTGNDTSAATTVVAPSAVSSDPFGMSSFGSNINGNVGSAGSGMENHQQMHASIINGFSSSNMNGNMNQSQSTMNFNSMTSTSPNYSEFSNLFTASSVTQPSILDSKRLDFSSHHNNVKTNGHSNNNAKNLDMSSLDMLDPFRM